MNKEDIRDILSKESLSTEEYELLNKWKAESEANANFIKELHQIKNIDLEGYETFDTDKAYQEVESKIQANADKQPKNTFKYVLLLALLVLGSYAIWQFLQSDTDSKPETYFATEIAKKNIDLDDGTKVILDKATVMEVTEKRAVQMTGRAFFDVFSDKDHPFDIVTPKGNIKVLGTSFSVVADSNTLEIFVEEGRVQYINDDRNIDLTADDYLMVDGNNIIKLQGRDRNYLSWKSGLLTFRDTPLPEVIKSIERHYKRSIKISDLKSASKCRLTTTFKDQSLKEVLNELKTLLGLKYIRNGQAVNIIDMDC